MTRRHTLPSCLIAALALLAASPLVAAEFEFAVDHKLSQTDGPQPVLVLTSKSFIEGGKVTLKSSSAKGVSVKLGAMNPGVTKKIPLRVKEGTHAFEATIEAKDVDGAVATIPLEFSVARVPAITFTVDAERTDPSRGQVPFRSNRPIDRVEATFYDKQGTKIGGQTKTYGGRYGDLNFDWTPGSKPYGAIEIRAYDVDGFWSGVMLEPWWVEIAHKDIIFDFGKDSWQPSEEPKLSDSAKEIATQMAQNAKHRPQMKLYVAGYTDTVGGERENQVLSEKRARAIGRWFREHGIDLPVYYQGFGEAAQAVSTPDNTAEPKNRRAIYMLGNAAPPTSASMPRSSWRRVK